MRRREVYKLGFRLGLGLRASGSMLSGGEEVQTFLIAASDEFTALTTGTEKATFRMPYDFQLTEVRSSLTIAPVGSSQITDINDDGVSILSTKLSIDTTELSSLGSVSQPVLSVSGILNNSEITIDVDQIGSSTAGAGLKVYLIGTPGPVAPPSGEVPEQIANLEAWFDASDATTLQTTGALLDQWDDKSGNVRNITSSGASRPTVGLDGSFDAVEFSGAEQIFATGLTAFSNGGANTTIIVARSKTAAGTTQMVQFVDFGSSLLPGISYSASNRTITHNGSTSVFIQLSGATTNRFYVVGRCDGSDNADIIDDLGNAGTDTDTASLTTGCEKIYLGSSNTSIQFFDGYIFEIIYYSRRLSDGERTQITDYLETKWSL